MTTIKDLAAAKAPPDEPAALPVYKDEGLGRIFCRNGRVILPNSEGLFLSDDMQVLLQLAYFEAKGLVSLHKPAKE